MRLVGRGAPEIDGGEQGEDVGLDERDQQAQGLEQDGVLHPLQEGFMAEHGLQCGYCTPGMLMTSYAFLKKHRAPTEEAIRWAISGNLCRCTGYVNIVKAIQYAAARLAQGGA